MTITIEGDVSNALPSIVVLMAWDAYWLFRQHTHRANPGSGLTSFCI